MKLIKRILQQLDCPRVLRKDILICLILIISCEEKDFLTLPLIPSHGRARLGIKGGKGGVPSPFYGCTDWSEGLQVFEDLDSLNKNCHMVIFRYATKYRNFLIRI
jgi:hypothetical protein